VVERDIRWIRWVTFLALIAVAAAFFYPFVNWTSTRILVAAFLVLIAAVFSTWTLELWLKFLLEQFRQKDGLAKESSPTSEHEANKLLEVARLLLSAPTQRDAIRIAMREGMTILGAKGASFVSFDEWKVQAEPLTLGEISPDLDGYIFSAPEMRQACKNCKARQAQEECLLCSEMGSGATKSVYCLPLMDGLREVGMINFYLSSTESPAMNNTSRLTQLGDLMNTALPNLNRRDQEMLVLRALQPSTTFVSWDEHVRKICDILSSLLGSKSVAIGLDFETDADAHGLQIFQGEDLANRRLPANETLSAAWSFIIADDDSYHAALGFNDSVHIAPLRAVIGKPFGFVAWIGEKGDLEAPQAKAVLQLAEQLLSFAWETEKSINQVEIKVIGNERIRLAREIHDSLAQTLAFLKLQSSQMLAYLNSGDLTKLESLLSDNYRTLSDAYQDIRFEIDNLRSLPEAGLQSWLLSEAETFTANTGIPVDISRLHVQGELGLMTQSQLIRVVQETLNNIRKHAQALKVVMTGLDRNGDVVIEIADDGKGFEPAETHAAGKYGIVGMRERVELAGGEFQIISRPGCGTTVRITLPTQELAKKSGERSSR
jgi:two-component system, NarL family, nitrate/nitrite sensor histidine kinase NarX